MTIDWLAYIINVLMTPVRNNRLLQLIWVLMKPVRDKHDELLTSIDDLRLQSATTWQTCWLEHTLRIKLNDNSITITEGDGQPTDFIVNASSHATESLLRGLVTRYKLPGKSFEVSYAGVTFSVRWIDPVCEREEPLTNVQWIDPVCEKEHGPLQVVDESRTVVSSIWFDNTGGYPQYTLFVEYPGATVSVSKISGDFACTVNIEDPDPQVPGRAALTITCQAQLEGTPERSWLFRFESGGETFDLTITQEAGPQP